MTTTTATVDTGPLDRIARLVRRIPLRPAEGWVTLIAAAVMAVSFALSLKDTGWVLGGNRTSSYMPWVALAGFGFGVAGAKVGWGRWRTHLVGATFAGLLLPLVAGGVVLDDFAPGLDPVGLAQRYHAMGDVAAGVWTDLAVRHLQYTAQSAHWHLIFGALIWGAGQLVGFGVFGHRRPLDAVVAVGLLILANMALTRHDQLPILVAFSSAALALLIRTHVFEEEVTWLRRRIGDPSVIGRLYLRGGAVFVTAAILGSVGLTLSASSAPLQGLWSDLPQKLQAATEWLGGFAPPGGDLPGTGSVSFGDNAVFRGKWEPGTGVAFRAQLSPLETEVFKWRVDTLAEYTNFGWQPAPTREIDAGAREPLLKGAIDQPTTNGRREVRVRIIPDGYRQPYVVSPASIEWVNRATRALVVGQAGWFGRIQAADPLGSSYEISALVPQYKDVAGGITQARLRYAGTDYPSELRTIYTQLPKDALGPEATTLLADIKAYAASKTPADAPKGNAYDLAVNMQDYFRNPNNFRYDADVREVREERCSGVSTAECFAIIRAGFCELYAGTMAVLLRHEGIPARIARGFLGAEPEADGSVTIMAESAHWWVEAYFPGAGWVEFDPTGGGRGRPVAIPSGSIGPATPRPTSVVSSPTFGDGRDDGTNVPPPPTGGGSTLSPGPFIAIGAILLAAFGVLLFTIWRRAPKRPMHPDQAWGALGRLATRFGLGPRPSQTVYEYAGALGDALPGARPELTTIANAKVEVAYGRGALASDRMRVIAEAYQRLRLALLGVALRRGLRRGRRSGR